jgi:DNA-binding beta-propeller fold protein YncE
MFHHYSISPDGKQIWQPACNAGLVFVVDIDTFSIVAEHQAGVGAGHVNFSQQLGLAVVTNHFDPNVSIIDMSNGTVWQIEVAHGTPNDGVFKQSHLNYVSEDGLYFYLFATHDGTFVEIDLINKEVSRTTYTGGTPEQSTS